MVRKLCRDNLTLHGFHSKSSSPAHSLLSPVSATRPVIFLDLRAVEYPMKRKSFNLNVLQSYFSSATSSFLGPHNFFGLLFSTSLIHKYILPAEEDTKALKIS